MVAFSSCVTVRARISRVMYLNKINPPVRRIRIPIIRGIPLVIANDLQYALHHIHVCRRSNPFLSFCNLKREHQPNVSATLNPTPQPINPCAGTLDLCSDHPQAASCLLQFLYLDDYLPSKVTQLPYKSTDHHQEDDKPSPSPTKTMKPVRGRCHSTYSYLSASTACKSLYTCRLLRHPRLPYDYSGH